MNKEFIDNNFNTVYRQMAKHLLDRPEHKILSRGKQEIYELVNPTFTLTHPFDCFATCRKLSEDYLKGEMEFYYSGNPFLSEIAQHSKFWEKVSDDGRTVNSNYGKLLFHDRNTHNYTQFEYASRMLLENPESKKAVMVIYRGEHGRPSKDNPCTMFLQFIMREGRLHLFVHMRSSDIWFGLPYDVPFFVSVQMCMLDYLRSKDDFFKGVNMGYYIHNSSSLHLYERNKDALRDVLNETEGHDSYNLMFYIENYLQKYKGFLYDRK